MARCSLGIHCPDCAVSRFFGLGSERPYRVDVLTPVVTAGDLGLGEFR